MKDASIWAGIAVAVIVGLGLILNPKLIPALPSMLHYILGIILLVLGGYGAFKNL